MVTAQTTQIEREKEKKEENTINLEKQGYMYVIIVYNKKEKSFYFIDEGFRPGEYLGSRADLNNVDIDELKKFVFNVELCKYLDDFNDNKNIGNFMAKYVKQLNPLGEVNFEDFKNKFLNNWSKNGIYLFKMLLVQRVEE